MLHARLHGRQARAVLLAIVLATGTALLTPPASVVADEATASAETLARSGRHAEAARGYEQQAKRLFRAWDTRLTLLAAREYLAAGQTADARRMLDKVGDRASGDDAILLARIKAEMALAGGDGEAALAALSGIPKPWPAPLETELLLLEAQAAFLARRTLDGIHALEQRGRLLGATDARDVNYRLLVNALQRSGATTAVPPGATDSDRGWIELAQLLAADTTGDKQAASRAADWSARHPNHPGTPLLPQVTPGAAASIGSPVLASGEPPSVALLLPLSGRQQAAGKAVRDGFLAAYLERPEAAPRVLVYDTAELGVVPAYERALADGAQFVIGPLTKDDVATLAAGQLSVPTLALNSFSGESPPPFLFQFSLDPEQEAREAARRIAADGLSHGIALFPRSAWGERLSSAFTSELQSTGVTLTGSQFYDPGTRDFSGPLRAALGRYGGAGDRKGDKAAPRRDAAAEVREGPQFVFIAATAQAARALKPQLRFQMTYDLPVYATSDAWDPSTRSAEDLDGMMFPEMPWILSGGQGATALWAVLQGDWAAEGRGRLRLYAFGCDALDVMTELRSGRTSTGIDGLTGRLTFGANGRIERTLDWARIEGGRSQPAGAFAAPPTSVP
jgi:outer membrane PBP1 activator LpoA protein